MRENTMGAQINHPIEEHFVLVQVYLHLYPIQIPCNKELEERGMIKAELWGEKPALH